MNLSTLLSDTLAGHRLTEEEGRFLMNATSGRDLFAIAAAADERLHPLRDTDEDRKLDEREIRHDAVGGDAGITGHRQDNKVEGELQFPFVEWLHLQLNWQY